LPGWGLLFLLTAGTLAIQGNSLWGTTSLAVWAIGAAAIIFGLGLCFFGFSMVKARFTQVAFSLLLAAMLVAPALWSALTTFNPNPNGALPAAGPARSLLRAGYPARGSRTTGWEWDR
jgi:hypothetical protein